jgi:hypothetical protein
LSDSLVARATSRPMPPNAPPPSRSPSSSARSRPRRRISWTTSGSCSTSSIPA